MFLMKPYLKQPFLWIWASKQAAAAKNKDEVRTVEDEVGFYLFNFAPTRA